MAVSITFNKEEFASLAFEEFSGKWNAIGLNELAEAEQDIISTFLLYCGAEMTLTEEGEQVWTGADVSNVLLVRSADGGILDRIYGPGLFNRDGEMILKLGASEFPVTVKGNEFTCGQLTGTLSFASEAVKVKVKDDSGEEVEVEFFPATLDLMPDNGDEVEYKINVQFDVTTKPAPATVKATLKRGESIAKFLKAPSEGSGTEAIKMADLGEGEFDVSSYREINTQNGLRYVLQLTDGTETWSRGMVDTQLKDQISRQSIDNALATGGDVCLQITDIKEKGGKTYLNCVLRLRKARTAEEQAKAKTAGKRANTKPVAATA